MVVKYILQVEECIGNAAYNRVEMFCRGLIQYGINCELKIYKKSSFRYKFFDKIWALKNLLSMIIILICLSKNDVLIIYGENYYLKYLLKLPRKAKLLVERNEYSTYLIRENLPYRQVKVIKQFERLLAKCDGLIVCSEYLKEYYAQFTTAPIVIIPLVIDISLFKIADYLPQKYLAYCGDFGGNKDGLPILLEAFAMITFKYPDYKLYLIGDTKEDNTMVILNERVKQLGLVGKVIFTGRVSHSEMPILLGNASVLLLARPANKQAEGGIPSKLAEYLATGRPTLVTKVGELNKYFIDNKNIFFAQPDSVEDFSSKMDLILSDYTVAVKIGKCGANVVKQFDYMKQTQILINYILGLV